MTRDDARLFMRKLWREAVKDSFAEEAFEIAIKALEQPERKKGKWLRKLSQTPWPICSECGIYGANESNYCPNCGARMVNDEDRAD